jgi:squalene-associated FAD-dependent desaturase
MSSKSVIVVGGGLAGLSSAVALASAGWQVRLFEQRPFLGGRATSYVLPSGEHVDNCQHVTFGCCTNLDDFCNRVGSQTKIRFFDKLVLQDLQGRRGVMQAGILPAPLHLTGSFLTFAPLGIKDKLGIARAMWSILRCRGQLEVAAQTSMLDWLRQMKQSSEAIERFWKPVLVSALSEELDRIDVHYGAMVFWKSVLSNKSGYKMGVPAVALGELYDGCRAEIEKRGGEVIFRSPLRAIHADAGKLAGLTFEGGRVEIADAYVLALPHQIVAELLAPEAIAADPALANVKNIQDASITGVHLWFDRRVMDEPYLTLLETTTQWIFNKTALYGSLNGAGPEAAAGQYLQLVISASDDLLQKSRQEIVETCLAEVRHALPRARDAKVTKSTVIKEATATFSPRPGVDLLRPPQKSRIERLYLAGDWTATGWPATMEGAVRSGYLAAESILADAGAPQRFLRPDLPVEPLVRLLSRN